ncbi:Glycine zipper 2TM domain-containing protein [Sphingomonas laterariae]|uniref:17 kDa surface antigen n=1 Tax=Edaphosphingomonas laterariae TaxID=861865 RepID=A0A239EFI0_9SPHN|nr:glycine zipper 2TM domain-containing protein [Sphingomonas laterariae]SNS43377.1 Glycine zipper 2TM domain-containing protein [Sphingomonas laterariae]
MRKLILAAIAAAVMVPTAPALADRGDRGHGRYDERHGGKHYDKRGHWKGDRYYSNGRYDGRRLSRNDQVWRGNDGRYHCKRDNGTTGLIIGAAGGALLGRMIDTNGDRLLGTLLGGAGGALLGR